MNVGELCFIPELIIQQRGGEPCSHCSHWVKKQTANHHVILTIARLENRRVFQEFTIQFWGYTIFETHTAHTGEKVRKELWKRIHS